MRQNQQFLDLIVNVDVLEILLVLLIKLSHLLHRVDVSLKLDLLLTVHIEQTLLTYFLLKIDLLQSLTLRIIPKQMELLKGDFECFGEKDEDFDVFHARTE